ncbi:putative intracellular septation protein A [Jannaschia pagri]|uniref:Inner membrane-spanning protein YciB n=1 Tax=Jannaschia pagri TaxID=2829797 RepID=A0ABQ4NJX2_9RHOB|nr:MULTISPECIES: inner membrane-spanning protein YciB [unclassified Jannaschia]GIT90872.1 putative intracellular septation protein A [Jannaschia sp. AI_61]GIT94703.1 putative intracellular septation protein A [Jannaschia sp. AI_62]
MAEKTISPWVKTALELGPVLGFFAAYLWVKDDTFVVGGVEYDGFIAVTALFVPVLLLSIGILWRLTGKLSPMQVLTAVLVIVFGGLTVWLNDERFLKIKPTIINLLLGGVLFVGLWRGRSLLSMVLSEAMPMDDAGWTILTRRTAWYFVASAVANELVWRTQSTEVWVTFETFFLPGSMFAFFISQAGLIQRHALEDDDEDDDDWDDDDDDEDWDEDDLMDVDGSGDRLKGR